MDTINKRIDYLVMNFSKGSNTKFARAINSNEANVRNYRKSVQPNIEIVKEIVNKFDIRYEWILDGEEPMLKDMEYVEPEERLKDDSAKYLDKDRHIFALEDHIATLKNIVQELKEEIKTLKSDKND